MKTLKVLAIIGLVWYSIWTFVIMSAPSEGVYEDLDTAYGVIIFLFLYGVSFFIVALNKAKGLGTTDILKDMKMLNEVKSAGLLSEEEFELKKVELFNKYRS